MKHCMPILQHVTVLTEQHRWPFAQAICSYSDALSIRRDEVDHRHHNHNGRELSQQRWQRFRNENPALAFQFVAIPTSL